MQKPEGVWVPIATAFDADENVDITGLQELVQYIVQAGVDGLILAGTTGEFYALDEQDRKVIYEAVLGQVKSRVPVYSGTGAVTTRKALKLIEQAESSGIDGLLVITPFYISPSQEDLLSYYSTVAKATSLPIIIYSNPGRTGGIYPAPSIVAELSEQRNIVGIKDSSGDLALTAEYIDIIDSSRFAVLMGQDKLFFQGLIQGCSGLVAATANIAPKLLVDLWNAYRSKDWETCLELQKKVTLIRKGFELLPFPVAAKVMIEMIGIKVGSPRGPLGSRPISSVERRKLESIVEEISPWITR